MCEAATVVRFRPGLEFQRICRRPAAIEMPLVIALCISGWIACECRSLRREQLATRVLERDYHAHVLAVIYSNKPGRIFDDQSLDLRELRRGRLYVPVTSVSFHKTDVDHRAWEQLACFSHLKQLAFQDCRLDSDAEDHIADLGSLQDLELWRTTITVNILHNVSRLRRLESLTLDGTGLKDDWLQHVPALPSLKSLTLTGLLQSFKRHCENRQFSV